MKKLMATYHNYSYLLLHGAWHASWCWRYIKPALEQRGHTVIAPDLPGHGDNLMPFADIQLQTYVDYIVEMINFIEEPIILVGHSMAGAIISQVAEIIPQKIKHLIYICAFIPGNQQSLLDEAKKSSTTGLSTEMILEKASHSIALKISPRLIDFFYENCSQKDVQYALTKLKPEPSQPMLDKVNLSKEKFGSTLKHYIICLQDKVIPLAEQKKIANKTANKISELDTDHSPFFSTSQKLASLLLEDLF